MTSALKAMVEQLAAGRLERSRVIRWSAPVPSFGDPRRATLATLGLNPSNREFVDRAGRELDGANRRFPTLRSLQLPSWSDAQASHLQEIRDACGRYFRANPYDGWFRRLDTVIAGTGASFYGPMARACHLDLVPYATACKWSGLDAGQRRTLAALGERMLALALRESTVRVLVLNGAAVVRAFESAAGLRLEPRIMRDWTLPRRTDPVEGVSFRGATRAVADVSLGREITVLGYNHNIQSSFGVTTPVVAAIGRWVARHAAGVAR